MVSESENMRWFRQNVRRGARLALFALAVHMVVSFVHFHADGIATPAASGVSTAANDIETVATPGPAQPASSSQNSTPHDFCALCANKSLLGSLILPVPSAVAALREFDRIRYRYDSATEIPNQPRSSFHARAPPLA
jgi:hypothetical protein